MTMTERSIKEKLLLLLSGVVVVAVTPFAIFRLANEQWTIAILDISIVCALVGLFLHVYVHRETRGSGIVLALTGIAASLAYIHLLGASQILWLYPALTAVFFLLELRRAILITVLALAAAAIVLWGTLPTLAFFTLSMTLLTNTLFAYAFSVTAKRQKIQLRQLASVDPLTSAGNRRAQNEKLDNVSALFHRARCPCSILILDIDHFKQINDTYGHVIGDRILIELADLISSNTRSSETLYRYGGEEFIIVAENTRVEDAALVAEKLRERIDSHCFDSDIHLSVSVGVAELHRGEGRQGWLGRADQALFGAKRSGRNRVALAQPAPDTAFVPRLAAVRS